MSVESLYAALAAAIQNGQIDLWAASQKPALGLLGPVLQRFGISSSYVVTGASITSPPGAAVLAGNARFGVPGAAPANVVPVAVTLKATSPQGADAISLSLAFVGPWSFSTTFPTLPQTQIAGPSGVVLAPSFLAGLPLDGAALSAASGSSALQLTGSLPAAGALAPYQGLFAGSWPLTASGSVVLPASPADPPLLDIGAVVAGASLRAGPLTIRSMGLRLQTAVGLDPLSYPATSLSTLALTGVVQIGDTSPIVATVSTSLLASARVWRLMVTFDDESAPALSDLTQIASFLGVPATALAVPAGFVDVTGFQLSEVEVQVPAGLTSPDFDFLAVTLASTKEWVPPIPFLRVADVSTRWLIGRVPLSSGDQTYVSGSVSGSVIVGSPANHFTLQLGAYLPQFVLEAKLAEGDTIPLGDALAYFFGDAGPATGLAVTAFAFQADLPQRTYDALAEITTDWSLTLGAGLTLTLSGLYLAIQITQGAVTGKIEGYFVVPGGGPTGLPDPRFDVSAEYTGSDSPEGWVFSGSLDPSSALELNALVGMFLGITPPASLPVLSVERMVARIAQKSGAYALGGTIAGRWTPTLFGSPLKVSAIASADVSSTGSGEPATGRLTGRFEINRFAVQVGMDLGVDEPTYQLQLELGELRIAATTAWRGDPTTRHQVISVQLGGMTLGGLLTYLVNLAAPTLGFSLEAPWSVLDRIELSRFVLTVDPTLGTVEMTYAVDADLVVMRVDQVGVRYTRRDGRGAVDLILTGSFLGRTYSPDDPLSWDVVNDPPPAVPGQGETLVELRYLALGQRVTLKGDYPDTVAETVATLRQAMKPAGDPDQNPLTQPGAAGMRFAADSEWLIGLDVGLMETVDLAIVLNDARLYGLSLGLKGEKSGAFAGLRFEILYKKISDTVGMFRVELRLPEAFRHIELGEVSITIGVVVVEIYTNGNFMVDLGFPHDRDYSRSFTVEVFPFLGRGGVYFGLLDGATSRRVPQITNGTFSPVIELGVGLAVGAGKDVSLGPLSGGIYVQVEVIFQGVLGWFNPTSAGAGTAQYYWAQGMAGIHGKLYGQVDFKVIKASATIEAWAQATVTLEAYRAAIFRLQVGVTVEAEVTVLFISVSFSFSAELDVSFTLGSDQPTPWVLAPGQGTTSTARAARNILPPVTRVPHRRTALISVEHLRALGRAGGPTRAIAASDPPYLLQWNPDLAVFPGGAAQPVALTMLPAFSITDVPVAWDGSTPANPSPQYRVAFLLFAENGVTPGAVRAEERRKRSAARSAQAAATTELPADLLIEALLRWSIAAVTGSAGGTGAVVTAGQLALLAAQMDLPETADSGFAFPNLAAFFTTNLALQISGDPGGDPSQQGGMAVPMPPALTWTSPQATGVDLATYDLVGPLYAAGADQYRALFYPLDAAPSAVSTDDPSKYTSFASQLFCDWCLMVAKQGAQAAESALSSWTYAATTAVSLEDVAASFPSTVVTYAVRAGDTVDTVAASLGASPAELLYLNPGLAAALAGTPAGGTLQVSLGVSPEAVAIDNPGVPLSATSLAMGTLAVQALEADTLSAIATRFGLSGAAGLFAGTSLSDDARLLQPGASFAVPSSSWTAPATFTSPILSAAVFFVRYTGQIDVPGAPWYAQTVFDLNATALQQVDLAGPLPAGMTLTIPAGPANPAAGGSYTTVAGDTLPRIGAALALWQGFASGTGPDAGWPAFRDAVTQSGSTVTLPAATVAVLPGETVSLLMDRTILHAGDLAGLLGWIGAAPILAPLAVVPVPGAVATLRSGDTLAIVAGRYALALDDLAARVAGQAIWQGTAKAPLSLTVSHLLVQSTDTLVAAVLGGPMPADLSGQSSRMLLSGLRLPAPVMGPDGHVAALGALTALYDLTGQQMVGPAPGTPPDAVGLSVTWTVNSGFPWVTLMSSETVTGDVRSLAARVPQLAALNPGLRDPDRLRAGMVVQTGQVGSLVFTYTNQQLSDDYPAVALAVLPTRGPAPMPLAGASPRTHGLDHRVELQSPVTLPIPAGTALTGNPSLWPFPDDLIAQARAGAPTPYDVVLAENRPDASTPPAILASATWATIIPFTLRRLANRDHQYELRGADSGDRGGLLQLWRYLTAPATPAGTEAYLLLAPAPDAGNASGLAVLNVDPALTFLVKTNETTESAPGAAALGARDGTASAYYASFGDLAPWILLFWEGSVVGGEGYFLTFTAQGGGDLPESAFDGDGGVTLTLLVIAGEQQQAAPGGRALLPFNNAAIAAPGLDATQSALFVEAADDSELVTTALVPPGNAGFTLTLPVPGGSGGVLQLANLFSLGTWHVAASAGSPFQTSIDALPVGPAAEDGQHLPLWRRARNARWRLAGRDVPADPPANDYRRYDQVVPIARFGPASVAPAVPGLPDPTADPYRGIGASTNAVIQLGFADVLGNVTAPPPAAGDLPPGAVEVDVGYTDALAGVGTWSGVTTSYALAAQGSGVALTVTVASQPAVLQPGPGQAPGATLDAAASRAAHFAAAYYQLVQQDVEVLVATSLQQTSSGEPDPIQVGAAPLLSFLAGAYVASQSAASLLPVTPFAAAAGALGSIASTYGAGWADIAAANGALPAAALLGAQALTVPAYLAFAEGSSAASIVAGAPPGWPQPTAAGLLALTENAAQLPLRPGVVLAIPTVAAAVPAGDPSLDAVAAARGTTASLLASDNAGAAGILRAGFVFTAGGLPVTVGETPPGWSAPVATFTDVQRAFAAVGVNDTEGNLAAQNGQQAGMFVAGAELGSEHYVARAGDTLAANGSGASTAALAAANTGTANLFDAGALVYLGDFSPTPVIAADDPSTLPILAQRYGLSPEHLLAANAGLTIPQGSPLVVPGAVALPAGGAGILVPYTLRATDTLDALAALFAPAPGPGDAATNLAAANAAMPGTMAPDRTITVQTASTTTQAGDFFSSVLGRLQAQVSTLSMADLVGVLGGAAGALAAGGLLVCPPAVLSSPATGPLAPDQIPPLYGVDAVSFAQANAGVMGLIAPGVTLRGTDAATSITTGTTDTFNALVSRFAAAGVALGIADVVTLNPSVAFLLGGALALLPPAPATLTAALAAGAGPFASPAFPLTVTLRIQRSSDHVDPAFRTPTQDGPVERAESTIPAPSSAQGGALTLAAFSDELRAALPSLRLATGKLPGAEADLWIVSFEPSGIAQVDVAPGVTAPDGTTKWPRFFALRPLYPALQTCLGVPIGTLQPDGTLSPTTTPTDFQGVDVETWARRFLADVDLFLSAPYVDGTYRNAGARGALDTVLDAKLGLAASAAAGLAPVLVLTDPNAAAGLTEAARVLEQRLRVLLSSAYDTSAIVQYDASVQSPWASHAISLGAALSGLPEPVPSLGAGDGPPFTLGAAKTSLSATSSFVTFLMRVSDVAHHRNVPIDLEYGFTNLELDIADEPGTGSFQSSRWLTFTPPVAGDDRPPAVSTTLGSAVVPLPLRAYPALPVLLGQSAAPTFSGPPTLAQAVQWTYGLTYAHEHAEQDDVQITATFNLTPPGRSAALAAEPDLASALAQYVGVADPLWNLLGGLADPSRNVPPATLANAATTFATLVSAVAAAWSDHWSPAPRAAAVSPRPATAPPVQSFTLGARVTDRTVPGGPPLLDTFVLTALGQPGPGGAWPDVSARGPDGTSIPLLPDAPVGNQCVYHFPASPGVPATDWPQLTLSWTGLSVAALQNARASLSVQRNQKLLGPDGPDTSGGFVYQTPSVDAPNVVAPLNTWSAALDVTSLGTTLEGALSAAFTALFGDATDLPVTLGTLYGYELVAPSSGDPGIVTYLPVALYPNQILGAGTASAVAGALASWQAGHQPVTRGGEWGIALTLYSQLDTTAPHPLLVLDRLVYRLGSAAGQT